MSEKDSAKDVIEAYRKKRQQPASSPFLWIGMFLLIIVGAAIVIFWLLGPQAPKISFTPPTATATATMTFTPTATATVTLTPTNTPTLPPPTDTPTPTLTSTPSGPSIYIVQDGDNLYGIAEKFGVGLLTLFALNPQINSSNPLIRVGDQIIIPAPNTTLPTATALPTGFKGNIEYIVASGDTLAGIAERFNSTVDAIVKANTLTNANDIKVGDKLKIPVNLVTPVPTATVGTVLPTLPIIPSQTPTPKP